MVSPEEKAKSVEMEGEEGKVREMAMKVVNRFGVVDAKGNPVDLAHLKAEVINPGFKKGPLVVIVHHENNRPYFEKVTKELKGVPGDRDAKIREVIVPSAEGFYGARIKWWPERSVVGGPGATLGAKTGIEHRKIDLTYPYPVNTTNSGSGRVSLSLIDYPHSVRNDSLTRGAFSFGIKDGEVVEGENDALLALNAPRALVLMTGHLGLSAEGWAGAGGVPCFFVGHSHEETGEQ